MFLCSQTAKRPSTDGPSVLAKPLADLPSDMLGCIAHCLPASDIFTLRQINQRLRRVCEGWLQRTRALSKRLTQRLAQLGLSHWPDALQQTGGVLSGSFVLHALNEPPSATGKLESALACDCRNERVVCFFLSFVLLF